MRCNMNKKFACLLGLLGLASAASAATAVVWSDEEGAKVTKEPAYFYTFDYGDLGASIDTTNVNGAKVLDFVAPISKESAGAGYGFGWQQNSAYKDVAISLSTYKGVCLVYEAQAPFRVDFKQSTITDDNYYGMELKATDGGVKKTFIAFASLTQGWKSATTKSWAVSSQTGVQFSYKNNHATASKLESNEVILHSFTLADECVTAAPNVKEGFAGYDGGSLELGEGKVHEIVLSDVFEDADGDDLKITVAITSENKSVVLMDTAKTFGLKDVLHFTTASNPDGPASVVITATDPTNKTAKFSFTFTTKDVENVPVAKDSYFEVKEDSSFTNGLKNRLTLMGSDADGDPIKFVLVSKTKNGSLDLDEETGIFTYTPNPDFYGYDTLTYKFVEVENPESESNIGVGVIKVINVNDPPEVKVLTSTYYLEPDVAHDMGDTLEVDEDFEPFTILVPKVYMEISDADGEDDYTITAKASAVFNAEVENRTDFYAIIVAAKKDSNGVGKLSLVVADSKISIPTVIAYVKVNPVVDPVVPVDDVFTVYQDSVNTIAAKNGVLKNDLNPDKDTTFTLKVAVEPEHGKLTLKDDGSFVYEAEADYAGEDAFAYKVVDAEGNESKMAIVTLNILYKNKAPMIVDGVEDTVSTRLSGLREDFNTIVTYQKREIQTWFEDDSTAVTLLKFTTRSDDSLMAPSFTSTGNLQIRAVKDACGEAVVYVTATDKQGASTDLALNAVIECVNDKPVMINDTLYISGEDFVGDYDLNNLARDPDGDTLIFNVLPSATNSQYFNLEQEDNILHIAAIADAGLKTGFSFSISVKVSDPTMAAAEPVQTLTAKLELVVGEKPDAIKPTIASTKMNWQGAIQANRGMAAIFDMQGRVMWKSALPVSESEVRAAAASVQGRKILKVNSQTYTIK